MNRLTPGRAIPGAELEAFVAGSLGDFGRPGEHVLVIVPDDTRTIPMSTIFDALCVHVAPRVGRMTILIALGTHPPMTMAELSAHFGDGWARRRGVDVVQHDWRLSLIHI